ncbi:CamS family sex pheromone protein [Virgibacillus ihumii]|uniref:CamS family sex pheromone protein n=1 Tax=Virgibacillus ihumii TaxID=2686091 RepID=UPI00157C9F3A|nr:CamS family sex pheromone protein [Virgibacillus ihumii]
MKKFIILLLGAVLILTSCSPSTLDNEEVVKKEDDSESEKTSIVPSYQLSDEMYKTILPYRPSAARGVIVNQMGNRLDIDEMSEGLRRHSKEYYDPNKYFFEEGQYLGKDMMYKWLERELTDKQIQDAIDQKMKIWKSNNSPSEQEIKTHRKEVEEEVKRVSSMALNPPIKNDESEKQQRNNPKYLSHILEQNYLVKKEDNSVQLKGLSIGIAMKSVYRFQTETGGPYYYEEIDKDVMLKKGKQIAQTVLKRIREMDGLKNIPILIAIYREEKQSSPVPGNYVAKTAVKGGDKKINEWEKIQEDYVLFPSDFAEEHHFDDKQLIDDFAAEIADYFPNYVGVIGNGFYIKNELKKLTLEIPIEFYGKGEVIGFTQYTYGLVKEMFPDYYDLEIKIKSNERLESFIYRKAGSNKPEVHILH